MCSPTQVCLGTEPRPRRGGHRAREWGHCGLRGGRHHLPPALAHKPVPAAAPAVFCRTQKNASEYRLCRFLLSAPIRFILAGLVHSARAVDKTRRRELVNTFRPKLQSVKDSVNQTALVYVTPNFLMN